MESADKQVDWASAIGPLVGSLHHKSDEYPWWGGPYWRVFIIKLISIILLHKMSQPCLPHFKSDQSVLVGESNRGRQQEIDWGGLTLTLPLMTMTLAS